MLSREPVIRCNASTRDRALAPLAHDPCAPHSSTKGQLQYRHNRCHNDNQPSISSAVSLPHLPPRRVTPESIEGGLGHGSSWDPPPAQAANVTRRITCCVHIAFWRLQQTEQCHHVCLLSTGQAAMRVLGACRTVTAGTWMLAGAHHAFLADLQEPKLRQALRCCAHVRHQWPPVRCAQAACDF